ncbi:2083_t:CDS:2 [Ambispora gerdemannii]|uniref:Inositol-1-monophosphatase n=1 Tax=Ambispora gerdemannii TaxID=144530 RepID=A0A9N9AVQ5_9GLOM|nr:2083_t:CDS:2 [Ambispora gerdemannii]
MSNTELENYLAFSIKLAEECGQVIRDGSKARYHKSEEVKGNNNDVFEKYGNPTDLVTETDRKVEEIVRDRISKEFPSHKFIGEETVAAGIKCEFTDDPTWIVDPIDGTTNFVQGFPFVAISIALAINKEPVVGVIYNPFMNELYTAIKGKGAYLNRTTRLPLSYPHNPLPLPNLSHCLVLTEMGSDRSPSVIDKKIRSIHNMVAQPGQSNRSSGGGSTKKAGLVRGIRCMGSAAVNLCFVAKGNADIYWEIGCWEWDVAAGIVICQEAGCIIVNANGPDESPVDILGRKFLAVRGCSPSAGDTDAKQSQLRIVRELWNVVEEIECPR